MRNESGPTSFDVFLSYSSRDKPWADAACAVLEQRGVRCWIAPRDITPGEEWGAAIIRGINGSRAMVVIFSGHANASDHVHREVERAISRGTAVLPLRVEDVRPEGAMEYALGNKQWLDAFTPPVEPHLERLVRSVKAILNHEAEPAAGTPPPIVIVDTRVTAPAARPRVSPPIAVVAALFGLVGLVGLGVLALATKRGEITIRADPPAPVVADPPAPADPIKKPEEPAPPKAVLTDVPRTTAAPPAVEPAAPPSSPARIPAAGPARRALWVEGGRWSVEGDQLVKDGLGRGGVGFGDPDWTDYDLTFEARKSAGPDGIGVDFRRREGKFYHLWLGGNLNKRHGFSRGSRLNRVVTLLSAIDGRLRPGDWYSVKVSARGPDLRVLVNGLPLFQRTDDYSPKGGVALLCLDSAGRFRNIKVTAPDGTVLWQGPPDLPEK